MKFAPLLLGLSVVANVALAIYVSRPHLPRSDASDARVDRHEAPTSASHTPEMADAALAAELGFKSWSNLAPAALLSRLRGAGFPPHLQRAILRAEVHRQFTPRFLQLLRELPEPPFWETRYNPFHHPKLGAAERKLRHERDDLVRHLLGPDARITDEFAEYTRRSRYGSIAPENESRWSRSSATTVNCGRTCTARAATCCCRRIESAWRSSSRKSELTWLRS